MSIDPALEKFEQRIEIKSDDIDLFDHVNNVVYLRWVQEISTAHWFSAASEEQKSKIGWVVVRHEIDYQNAVKLNDEIIGRTWVGVAQKNLFERFVEIVRSRDNKVMARSRSLWCPIDLQSRKITRVGSDIYSRFSVNENNS